MRIFGIDLEEAFERHASVVLDAMEHLQVRTLRTSHRGAGLAKPDLEVAVRVTIADHVEFAGQGELLGGVLANRLEQLVLTGGLMLSAAMTSRRDDRSDRRPSPHSDPHSRTPR